MGLTVIPTLEGDSLDYHLITNAIKAIDAGVQGVTCEIGVRRGGGSKYIMDALSERSDLKQTHLAIDPYGNIVYADSEGVDRRLDYTNQMRDQSMGALYNHAGKVGVNLVFFNMCDEEFFKAFDNGFPIYEEEKSIVNRYSFVHFDGPHQFDLIENEFHFFNDRMDVGSTIVFDDLAHYDHDALEKIIFDYGWILLEKTGRKASYQKRG